MSLRVVSVVRCLRVVEKAQGSTAVSGSRAVSLLDVPRSQGSFAFRLAQVSEKSRRGDGDRRQRCGEVGRRL